ncbi:hypothetical protein FGB62_282g03 [Gracilaria domingensis]|nr:hypothetical protein FGB62_282g03 [Gracilaria domingensis]
MGTSKHISQFLQFVGFEFSLSSPADRRSSSRGEGRINLNAPRRRVDASRCANEEPLALGAAARHVDTRTRTQLGFCLRGLRYEALSPIASLRARAAARQRRLRGGRGRAGARPAGASRRAGADVGERANVGSRAPARRRRVPGAAGANRAGEDAGRHGAAAADAGHRHHAGGGSVAAAAAAAARAGGRGRGRVSVRQRDRRRRGRRCGRGCRGEHEREREREEE